MKIPERSHEGRARFSWEKQISNTTDGDTAPAAPGASRGSWGRCMPPFSWDSSTPPCPGPGRAEQRWSWWCPRKNKALCWLCSSCSRDVSAVPASRTSGCCSLLPSSLLCSLPAWGGFQEHSHRPMGEDPCICKPGPAPGMCSSPTASRVWDRVMLSALRVQAAELPAFLTPQCCFEAIQP